MPVRLDAAFFHRADQLEMAAFKDALLALFLQTLKDATEDAAALAPSFDRLWHEATGDLGLEDRLSIARYMNIRLLQDRWSQSDLHRAYVNSMLHGQDNFIDLKDGIAAVHQNILEQHYAG
jgi:hypothetical protein